MLKLVGKTLSFAKISALVLSAFLAGCQSSNESTRRPADTWKYTALQKAEQELSERAAAGEFGNPNNGTFSETKFRAAFMRAMEKYRSQGYN